MMIEKPSRTFPIEENRGDNISSLKNCSQYSLDEKTIESKSQIHPEHQQMTI